MPTQTEPANTNESTAGAKKSRKKTPSRKKLKVPASVLARFESYIDKKSRKCWTWKGSRTEDGYGQFWVNDRKVVKAHRFAFEIFVRQLSRRERLRNTCRDKNCMNPSCWEAFAIGQKRPPLNARSTKKKR